MLLLTVATVSNSQSLDGPGWQDYDNRADDYIVSGGEVCIRQCILLDMDDCIYVFNHEDQC